MTKNILITGIAGSGGSYLAERIVKESDVKVWGTYRWHSNSDNPNLKNIREKINLLEGDLTDNYSVMNILKKAKPDVIYHLASYANMKSSFEMPSVVIHNNVLGTSNILEAVRNSGTDPKIVLATSAQVYGDVEEKYVPIKEDECPLKANNPYSATKIFQDIIGETYFKTYGAKIIRVRGFGYVNPRRLDLVTSSFADKIAKIEQGKLDVLTHGSLEPYITLMDIRDAMEAYYLAENCKPGEAYNIGSTKPIQIGEILDILKSKAKCEIPTRVDPVLLRPVKILKEIPNTDKFQGATGWKPKYSLEESLDNLLNYYREKNLSEK